MRCVPPKQAAGRCGSAAPHPLSAPNPRPPARPCALRPLVPRPGVWLPGAHPLATRRRRVQPRREPRSGLRRRVLRPVCDLHRIRGDLPRDPRRSRAWAGACQAYLGTRRRSAGQLRGDPSPRAASQRCRPPPVAAHAACRSRPASSVWWRMCTAQIFTAACPPRLRCTSARTSRQRPPRQRPLPGSRQQQQRCCQVPPPPPAPSPRWNRGGFAPCPASGCNLARSPF